MWNCRAETFANVLPDIKTHQICQTESCCLRPPHQRTCERVHFIDGVIILKDVIHRKGTHSEEDTITDKVRCILTQHNSFAQTIFTKQGNKFNHFLCSILRENDLQQLQITRRIEKMCSKKMLPEFLRTTFGNIAYRNTRSVRGNNRCWLPYLVNARHLALFYFQVLNNGFNDP